MENKAFEDFTAKVMLIYARGVKIKDLPDEIKDKMKDMSFPQQCKLFFLMAMFDSIGARLFNLERTELMKAEQVFSEGYKLGRLHERADIDKYSIRIEIPSDFEPGSEMEAQFTQHMVEAINHIRARNPDIDYNEFKAMFMEYQEQTAQKFREKTE